MKKKGLLAIILCFAMSVSAVGVLASCAPKDSGTVLKVAGLKGAYGDEYWKELKKGFEAAYPGTEVQLTIEAKVEETIAPQLMAGNGPDVLYLATNREYGLTEMLIKSKSLLPMKELLEKNVYNESVKLKDRILPSIMGNGVTDPTTAGEHIMLPLFFSSNGLFFNADKFYDNNGNGKYDGLKDGKYEMPTTWADMLALGAILKQGDPADYGSTAHPALFTYPTSGYLDTMIPASIASSAGTEKLAKCFTYAEGIWQDAQVKAVFQKLGDLAPYVHPSTVSNWTGGKFKDNQQYVIDGKALFMTNGDWVKGEMKDTTPAGFNWGSAPFLAFEQGGARYGTVNAEQMYINKNSKVLDLAEKFVLYMYSKDGLAKIAKYGNGAFVPARGYDTIALEQGMNAGAVAGYKGYYDGTASILIGAFATSSAKDVDWKATYCKYYDNIVTGTKTVDEWITKISSDSDKMRAGLAA